MKKKSSLIVLYILSLGIISIISIIACNQNQSLSDNLDSNIDTSAESEVERGEYLVQIMGCNDCHSPKRMGPKGPEIIPELMLSGFPADRGIVEFRDTMIQKGFAQFYPDLTAAAGPWGITFAGNLTPDESGIGTWSEEQFITAFTKGKFKGMENGRNLLPPMPVENYREMKREDVIAIFSYLKSIKPVRNVVPANISPDKMLANH